MKILVQNKTISMSQLANKLGVTIGHLNPAMRALRKDGFIQWDQPRSLSERRFGSFIVRR